MKAIVLTGRKGGKENKSQKEGKKGEGDTAFAHRNKVTYTW